MNVEELRPLFAGETATRLKKIIISMKSTRRWRGSHKSAQTFMRNSGSENIFHV
jgi:hypothetical protein